MHGRSDRFAGFNARAGHGFSGSLSASSAHFDLDLLDRVGPEQVTLEIQRFGDDIRRNPDGSIDFNSYRSLAVALRRQAMRDPVNRRFLRASFLVWMAAFAVIFLIQSTPAPAPHVRAVPAHSHATPTR